MRSHSVPASSFIAAVLASGLHCMASAGELTPLWTHDFRQAIVWQQVTTTGQLIVNTEDGLYSLDPAAGTPLWTEPAFGSLERSSFREITGTPLAMISDDRDAERVRVINVFTGAVVFDSKLENLTEISSTEFLPRSGGLLIAGLERDKTRPMLFLFDIGNGSRRWAVELLAASNTGPPALNRLAGLLLAAAITVADLSPVQSEPLELDDGSFLLGAMGKLYRIDAASGDVLWETPFAGGDYTLVRSPLHPDAILVGAAETETVIGIDETERQQFSTQYQTFRLADGAALWNRPVRFNELMNELIQPVAAGYLVSEAASGKNRLHLLAYADGERPWGSRGRGLELSGRVLDYQAIGDNLILTTGYDSIWTNKDTEYQLYVLDPAAGAFRFEEPVNTRGRLLETELGNRGLLYVTTHEVNMFDPASGALLAGAGLRSREPIVTANEGRSIHVFNAERGLLYRFDRDSGEIAQASGTPFEFPDNDSALSLDLAGDRIVLRGRQTVAGFSRDGALAFQTHYRGPRDPAWLRSLAWAEGVRAGMASAYAGAYSAAAAQAAANAADGSLGQELGGELARGFSDLQQGYAGLASEYVSFARRRYEASAESREFAFMMTQDDDRRALLLSVSKHDGSIAATIAMGRDKEPSYQVDDVSGYVFYQPTETTISAYRFAGR
jgi:outer membrane protein assembly factor BamB